MWWDSLPFDQFCGAASIPMVCILLCMFTQKTLVGYVVYSSYIIC